MRHFHPCDNFSVDAAGKTCLRSRSWRFGGQYRADTSSEVVDDIFFFSFVFSGGSGMSDHVGTVVFFVFLFLRFQSSFP